MKRKQKALLYIFLRILCTFRVVFVKEQQHKILFKTKSLFKLTKCEWKEQRLLF